jgi:hypothetical protein
MTAPSGKEGWAEAIRGSAAAATQGLVGVGSWGPVNSVIPGTTLADVSLSLGVPQIRTYDIATLADQLPSQVNLGHPDNHRHHRDLHGLVQPPRQQSFPVAPQARLGSRRNANAIAGRAGSLPAVTSPPLASFRSISLPVANARRPRCSGLRNRWRQIPPCTLWRPILLSSN